MGEILGLSVVLVNIMVNLLKQTELVSIFQTFYKPSDRQTIDLCVSGILIWLLKLHCIQSISLELVYHYV